MRQFASAQQIEQLEQLAVAIPWGFESPLPHQSQKQHEIPRRSGPRSSSCPPCVHEPGSDWASEDKRLYEQTKRELTGREWAAVNDYANAKTDVIEAIIWRGE